MSSGVTKLRRASRSVGIINEKSEKWNCTRAIVAADEIVECSGVVSRLKRCCSYPLPSES